MTAKHQHKALNTVLNNSSEGTTAIDERAKRILFDTYWSEKGWRDDERKASFKDFEYAKSMGVMFDSARITHDDVIGILISAVQRLDPRVVANAFLASLTTQRLDWRSALGSYAVFHALPHHDPKEDEHGASNCECCGLYLNDDDDDDVEDFNVLNFERLKWGGVRHLSPAYALLDLELFSEMSPSVPAPTSADVHLFKELIKTIADLPPGVSSAALQKYFPKDLKSNKAEREVIIGILGYCGILGTPEHPGFANGFVQEKDRALPNRRFVDMDYPACWWSSEVSVNHDRLVEYFGHIL